MKTSIKEKKAAKAAAKRQEDIKFYRLIIEFVLAIVALFLAIKAGNNQLYTLSKIMPLFLTVTGVLFGASAVYFSVMRAKRVDESKRIVTSAGVFGNAAVLFLLAAAFYLFMNAQLVISTLIALIVVYIVYNVEGAGFFGYSVLTAASYIVLMISGQQVAFTQSLYAIADIGVMASKVLAFVLPAIMILVSVLIYVKKRVTVLGVEFSKKRIATAMLIGALAALAGAVLNLVYPVGVAASMYAMVAIYFIAMVIGIFKMM